MLAPALFGGIATIVAGIAPAVNFSFPDLDNTSAQEIVQTVTAAAEEERPFDLWKWAAILGVGIYVAGAAAFLGRMMLQIQRLRHIASYAAAT